jgi:hypothetical protein
MKSIRFLSGFCLMAVALLFVGNYSYCQNRGTQDNQAPVDSNFGNQYGNQNYPDSSYGDQNNHDFSDGIVNNYSSPYWDSPFYDPFFWDPYGIWSFAPGFYYGAFGFYPYYHNHYYGGYGYGYWHSGFIGTRGTGNIRNNDGFRNISGINSNKSIPKTTARTLQTGTSRIVSSAGNISRTSGRNNRSVSRQTSQMQRRYNNSVNSSRRNLRSAPQRSAYFAPRSYGSSDRSSGGGRSGGGRRR